MESVELGLDDMFDERDIDEDENVNQGMADNNAAHEEQDENGDLHSQMVKKVRDMSAGAAKKVVKNPQPKLDATRLNSDRGFPALRKIFEGVKFKGKGHEISDFLLMMSTIEHWAHRLYPKMTFDEVIERCERLGSKQQVKTVIRKIRMGMPVLDDEFVETQVDSDSEENQQNQQGAENNIAYYAQFRNPQDQDEFNELVGDASPDMIDEEEEVDSVLSQFEVLPTARTPPSSPPKSPVFGQGLKDEQKARMERNKMLALQKREARLMAMGRDSDGPGDFSPSQPTANQTLNTVPLLETKDDIGPSPTERDEKRATKQYTESQTKNKEAHNEDDILFELSDDFELDEKLIQETESQQTHIESVLNDAENSELQSCDVEMSQTYETMEDVNEHDLTPKMDAAPDMENDQNTRDVNSEQGLILHLYPDSSPPSHDQDSP